MPGTPSILRWATAAMETTLTTVRGFDAGSRFDDVHCKFLASTSVDAVHVNNDRENVSRVNGIVSAPIYRNLSPHGFFQASFTLNIPATKLHFRVFLVVPFRLGESELLAGHRLR